MNTPELRVVNEDTRARSFRMTIGLREGYGKGKVHKRREVKALVEGWHIAQRALGNPYLPGIVSKKGDVIFNRRSDAKPAPEKVVFYEGEVSPEYNAHLSDEEVVTALKGLAGLISRKLKQQRIYLRYRDLMLILEKQPEAD